MLTLKSGLIRPQDPDDFLDAAERALGPLEEQMEYRYVQHNQLPDQLSVWYTWLPQTDPETGVPIDPSMTSVSANVIYHDDDLGKRPWWSTVVPGMAIAMAVGGIIDAIITRSK